MRQASDEPGPDRIGNKHHDDGNRFGGLLGGECVLRPRRNDDVHRETDELGRKIEESLWFPLCPSVLKNYILSHDVAVIPQSKVERLEQTHHIRARRTRPEDTYPGNLPRLLRPAGQRCREEY